MRLKIGFPVDLGRVEVYTLGDKKGKRLVTRSVANTADAEERRSQYILLGGAPRDPNAGNFAPRGLHGRKERSDDATGLGIRG